MAWVYVDDQFNEHPKMTRVGPLGWGVWLAGLAYCNRNLTDGFIPWNVARTLCSFEVVHDDGSIDQLASINNGVSNALRNADVADLLVEMGLWKEVTSESRVTGYRVHDYLDWQKSRREVLAERSRNAERQAKHRQRVKKRKGSRNTVTNDVTNGVSNGPVTSAPTPSKEEPPNVGSSTTAPLRAAEFDQFWSQYPKRAGSNPKLNAIKAWNASIRRGVSPADILSGLHRYVEYLAVTGDVGTKHVLQASTFVGPSERWKESWDPPKLHPNGKRRQLDDYQYKPTEEVKWRK